MVEIINDLLTEEQKQLLSTPNFSVKDRLLALYGEQYGIYNGIRAKIAADNLIRQNAYAFELLKRQQEHLREVSTIEAHAPFITTKTESNNTRDVIDNVSTSAQTVGATHSKARAGSSQYDEEFDKEKEGDREDQSILAQLAGADNPGLAIESKEVDGEERLEVKKVEGANLPQLNLDQDQREDDQEAYLTGLSVDASRVINIGRNKADKISRTNTRGIDKGTIIKSDMNKGKAVHAMQRFQFQDIANKILTSFQILFDDRLPCL